MKTETFHLEEATIFQLQQALSNGIISSVELTSLFLNRIFYYDHNGIKLNSIPVLNKDVLKEAEEADRLRAEGIILGDLHGIPFTVKDSYMAKGLTVASGSPAFANLIADSDSFILQKIREAGGILIGKTNMPPMAAGGMQKGVYGRSESPYNGTYLPAAWFSGSSHGSAVSTAANLAVFGMAEETVSSGRSPASNNGLVAYTPSRGILSIRGNWPLFPTRDVVVPHTKTMEDMLTLLDVLVSEDPVKEGDFWREQTVVELPLLNSVRPPSYSSLKDQLALKGKRIGMPKMYIGKGAIYVRPSILELWNNAVKDLENQGATVIEIDFPLQDLYDKDPFHLRYFEEEGLLPKGWMEKEWNYLNAYAAEKFLRSVGDPNYPSWEEIDPYTVFPNPEGSIDKMKGRNNAKYAETIAVIKEGIKSFDSIPHFKDALKGLENIRKGLFEDWMSELELDAIAFPANCNIGKSDADTNEEAYNEAWENGNFFSNGNHMLRHLGIPSVSVCMGIMNDTNMPVSLTFLGKAYNDNDLLRYAYHYERVTKHRQPGFRTPPLVDEEITYFAGDLLPPVQRKNKEAPDFDFEVEIKGGKLYIEGKWKDSTTVSDLRIYVNGEKVKASCRQSEWYAEVTTARFLSLDNSGVNHLSILVLSKDFEGNARAKIKDVTLPFISSSRLITV